MDELVGRRLRVHHNLHRGDVSVLDPRTGLLITNVHDVMLTGCVFHVGESMRQKTIATGRRKVMAYVIGHVEAVDQRLEVAGMTKVTYNPFRMGAFHVADTSEEVWSAETLYIAEGYCWIPSTALRRSA